VTGRRHHRAASLLAGLLLLAAGCVHRPPPAPLARFEFDRPEMGLPFHLALYAPSPETARDHAEAAFARISELNGILTDYDDNSELSRLSKASGGPPVHVGPDLWNVLARAREISKAGDGAFDITVGPLVQVWKRARRQRELPAPAVIEAAKAKSGWTHLTLDPERRTARLDLKGMRLDPGGIAKGYALDEAAKVLHARGVKSFLVSGGGDMVVGDAPPGHKGWRIALGVFDTTPAPPPRFVLLHNYALLTSGDQFQRAEINGVRYSHIVDPRTGVGLTDHSLVTILSPNGMTGDALSKVVSVLGPAQSFPRLRQFHGVEAFVMRRPGDKIEEYATPGFKKWLEPPSPAPVPKP
jgi:FAD:protein FMN transferase